MAGGMTRGEALNFTLPDLQVNSASDGRYKNDNYKRDPEWIEQRDIWFDPPGETASHWLLHRLTAIRRMQEIELRVSC